MIDRSSSHGTLGLTLGFNFYKLHNEWLKNKTIVDQKSRRRNLNPKPLFSQNQNKKYRDLIFKESTYMQVPPKESNMNDIDLKMNL